jgi:hypothetical protein
MLCAQISVSLNTGAGSIGARRGRCLDKLRGDPPDSRREVSVSSASVMGPG